ncbi:hypothetical protein ILUMI_00639 [Ignelater luminosus]|uniref:CCR4-NOT transcription complex subunit 10 n=1 Tax=Ignelater luminosus TaxID=2038154 RepID=A0A8K0GI79_IGNLU|nr:hypothetical protein ILUMI_00639 [Ignelater luminosus]
MADKDDLEKSADCVTDQERDFAQNALTEFQRGNYGASLQNINKLDCRASDIKVIHNKSVVEYCKSDLKKTDNFLKSLKSLYVQFDLDIKKLDDVDQCIPFYNHVVVLFHKREYAEAIRIMEGVYKFVEPMDESLAMQVGLLLIELHICTRQLNKAISFISYFENQLFNINPLNVKQGEKLLKQSEKEPKENKKVAQVSNAATEEFKKKLVAYKARCFLMTHALGSARKEIQALFGQNKTSLAAQFLKANLEYLQGNYNEAIEILNNIQTDNLTYSESAESALVMQYNNLGAIHHAMGKPNLACHYYQKALKADIAFQQNSKKDSGDKPLYMLTASKYHELMYNLGISMLHAGRPQNAFDCLIIAVRRFHRNSRLWLRLAECCIQVHKESNEIDFDIQKKQKEMVIEVIGAKKQQKIVLTKNLSKDKKYSAETQSYAVPVPTLEFASLCLRNAYLLLPSDTVTSPVPLLLMPVVTPPTTPPPSPGPAPSTPLSPSSVAALRNAILAASAYVSLCLGDYLLALEYAQNLLTQPRLSGVHRLLAHLYAAEALVLLDRISDALDHLNPENVKDMSLEFTTDEGSSEEGQAIKTNPPAKWFPSNLASAHAVMQYNIAVCKTLRGQLDQAAALLKQIWQGRSSNCKVPALIIMLVLYIELQLGHADVARSLIKQYSLQCRMNG